MNKNNKWKEYLKYLTEFQINDAKIYLVQI